MIKVEVMRTTVHTLKFTPLSKCGMPLWITIGRELFENAEIRILLNCSESEILFQSEPQKNRVPKGEHGDFSCAAQVLCSACVTFLAKSGTSPACQCTHSSAFQQLDSNAFGKDKGHMCSTRACLIDYKLLPLAFHKKSPRTCSKAWKEKVVCVWRNCPG